MQQAGDQPEDVVEDARYFFAVALQPWRGEPSAHVDVVGVLAQHHLEILKERKINKHMLRI